MLRARGANRIGGTRHMDRKARARDRLAALKPLDGVLATASQHWARSMGQGTEPASRDNIRGDIAREIEHGDTARAAELSRSVLRSALPSGAFRDSAIVGLADSDAMRWQLSGFAGAGIDLFHAGDGYLRSAPEGGRDAGGVVSPARVVMDPTRILLETPRVIVQFDDAAGEDDRRHILLRYGLTPIGHPALPPPLIRLTCPATFSATEVALSVMEEEAVIFAEPDFIEHIAPRHIPQDPDYARQWQHRLVGAEAAWDISTGVGIHVAMIDNGFDTGHDELRFGPLSGWFRPTPDFADTEFVPGPGGMPTGAHGTACAGMIAATEGNSIGGCGLAFGAELSALACIADQVGTQSTLASAVARAADPAIQGGAGPGADIICCALGPNGAEWRMRQVLADAITFAARQGRGGLGCAIFWASTNGNHPIADDEVCSHPDVIAVGRSTEDDTDDESGFGPELEFLAPGVSVWLPTTDNTHAAVTGTSFAAPAAAAIGALALACDRGQSAEALRETLRRCCDRIGPNPYGEDGRNAQCGHGRLNALAAVRIAAGAWEVAGGEDDRNCTNA